jgi:hypothetical protein
MLNRAALVVRPKQPVLDWAAQLDDSGLVPNVDGEQTVYLVAQFDDDGGAQKVLQRVFAEVVQRELFGWHADAAAWPLERTFALFRKWFTVELHSVVEDLCNYDLMDDAD